jgi:phosphate transport system substrate-binding protein
MQEIRDLLTGKLKENLIPVFDGVRATSTVRFMIDSVLKGQPLGKNVAAAQSSVGVIDYVARTPNAIGFVGFSWLGNMDDPVQAAYRKKVRIAYVESTDSANAYVLPSQYFIYTHSYPMVRDLVYVLKEKHDGLGHAFARFMADNRGQLIFRRAYLMPALRLFYVRNAEVK